MNRLLGLKLSRRIKSRAPLKIGHNRDAADLPPRPEEDARQVLAAIMAGLMA